MSVKLLLGEFERVSEAPEATVRLRRFVLDLAVRGRLTHRDPSDEPASRLLIELGRKLVESSRPYSRRNAIPTAPLEPGEVPFSVPEGWLWTRVRQVTQDHGQATPSSEFAYIDVSAIDKEAGRIREPIVLAASDAPSRARKIVKFGDVLYSCVRPYLLNIAVVDIAMEPQPIASTAFAVMDGLGLVAPRYLWTVLRSSYFVECVEEKMRGQAYPAINDSDFALLPIPLPPLAEQHRIVAKVNELMALCDQLEAAQKEREVRRDGLSAASLQRLTSTDGDRTSTAADVRLFLRQSPRLITKPEHVTALRKTILDLGVAGRLTRLGGISRWTAETLASVCDLIVDGDHNPPARQPSGIPHLTAKHITGGEIDVTGCTFISEEDFALRRKRYSPRPGDLIVTCVGTLGRTAIVRDGPIFSADRNLAALRPQRSRCTSEFLKLVVDSPSVQTCLTTASGQTAQPHIYLKDIRAQTFLLPSLAEQHRIVAKVRELMTVCNEMETALTSAQDGRGRLLEALLYEALGTAAGQEAVAG